MTCTVLSLILFGNSTTVRLHLSLNVLNVYEWKYSAGAFTEFIY
jgi:hypothetical protein